MSFVKNIFNRNKSEERRIEVEEVGEESDATSVSEESSDTGFFTSPNSSGDLDTAALVDTDCNSISNFFGYWKNLINQEAKYQSQLNDLSKQLALRDAEANKLRFQMDELQRDVFAKSAGIDRLEAELQAAHKETELIRQRIRHLENDLDNYRRRNKDLEDDIIEKEENFTEYESNAKSKIEQLETLVNELQEKIKSLEYQLKILSEEKRKLDQRHAELLVERENEKRKVSETLEQAKLQKLEIEKKWKTDFEQLRTVNILKEQQLLDDFEWKLREVQQTCKKRLEDKDKVIEERLLEAYKDAEKKMKQAEELMAQMENVKTYEIQIEELKDLTQDQERNLKEMREQHDQMKETEDGLRNETKKLRNMIELEKENLQHMQRIHHQEILDKERTLKQTLNSKRIEIAVYWEERLLRECGRLKNELEQIHDEEKFLAMETARKEKDEEMANNKKEWDRKLRDCLKEINLLKRSLTEKDSYYQEEIVRSQTSTDRDIMELRRLMDKIDMMHHEKYEKLVNEHDEEIERINEEHVKKIHEVELYWQNQLAALRSTLESAKEQMEQESEQKIDSIIHQHRTDLDSQWENLIHQKDESIRLMEEEYVSKYKTLEEQCQIQQKSHSSREIELLKTIDSLKNELQSKSLTIDDLQNNVETLEGGVQVLNNEIAQQGDQSSRSRKESEAKIRGLQETVAKLMEQQEKEREQYRMKFFGNHKQNQETIDHLQRKCQCLTKLFEEVRQRYERRESRLEDLNKISDLKQVIAEQEKDLACINEEKRYFQMRLMSLEKQLEENASFDSEYDDPEVVKELESRYQVQEPSSPEDVTQNGCTAPQLMFSTQLSIPNSVSIPPTIVECDE
ncbi:unnamed protein product [Brassicogethes aeneus]|uniref:Uncharacterized protein n=1 Tax=Brassicogethes aeneus TaxID=1431903 RepID=A0A9P0FLI1_BRAAE|nr:unnamed protein product [Brassicogethes aeneus]